MEQCQLKAFGWKEFFSKLDFAYIMTIKCNKNSFIVQVPCLNYKKTTTQPMKGTSLFEVKTTDESIYTMTFDFSKYIKTPCPKSEFIVKTYRLSQFLNSSDHMNNAPVQFDFQNDCLYITRRNISKDEFNTKIKLKSYKEIEPWNNRNYRGWKLTLNHQFFLEIMFPLCVASGTYHRDQRISMKDETLILESQSKTSCKAKVEIKPFEYFSINETYKDVSIKILPFFNKLISKFPCKNDYTIHLNEHGIEFQFMYFVPTQILIPSIHLYNSDIYQ